MAFIRDFTSNFYAKINSLGALFATLKDGSGNDLSLAQRETLPSSQEALLVAGKNDNFATILRTDRKGNLLTGNYQPEFFDNFEGATVNVQKWLQTSANFSGAQSTASGMNFNSTNITTVSSYLLMLSIPYFRKIERVPLQMKLRLRHNLVSGSIADFGFGVASGTTEVVPTGVKVRFTTSGSVYLVMTIASAEVAAVQVAAKSTYGGNTVDQFLNMSSSAFTNNYFVYDLIIDDDNAVLTIQDTESGDMIGMASLPVPRSQFKMIAATALPCFVRLINAVAPASYPIFILSDLQVLSTDWQLGADASQTAAMLHLSGGRQPFTGVQNENHTNSAAPASATLSNTAAGYTTLGGKFQFAAVAGAETDYALFGYTVPANSRFLCEGVRIETFNMGAAVATTPTLLEWAASFNGSAVSLATANLIRRQLGVQSLAVGAGIGAAASPVDVDFKTPEVTESGRFLVVILKMPVGTATASQIIRGQVLLRGRFI